MNILKVNGVKKIYTTRFGGNKVEALKNVSFSVEQGEYVAIMGESGSGKSTLLNILAALDKPTAGTVLLDGKDISMIKESQLCDTNHILYSDYSEVIVVGAGADAVDYKLISICHKGDIVVSQDYGVAAMALGKGAYAIHQSGKWYTNENIDQMLMERHLNKKARRSSHKNHIKGARKRTEDDDVRFAQSFEKLILMAKSKEGA